MSKKYIFSSESVTEGHPDKVADTISDAVLDACLAQDPLSRVACETLVKSNLVVVAGEITTKAKIDYVEIVRQAIRRIGYCYEGDIFHADRVHVLNALTPQSPDIAQGVDERQAEGKATAEQGAGDQGLMFGFACNETPELMPAPIVFAHRIGRRLTEIRKQNPSTWIRPDSKTQVSVQYEGYRPIRIDAIVVSTQHAPEIKHSQIYDFVVNELIPQVIPAELIDNKTRFLVNPTGRFVIGGPEGDSGLTGRKIIVDTYGGMGRHGGGAFSGKDPTKVDRSAAYMGRYVAKNIVAAGLADRAEVQFAYAIGYPEPVSICVDTFGTGKIPDEKIEAAVREVFSFKPANIIRQLNLLRPIYSFTTNYGHFGREDNLDALTWERIDKVEALRAATGLN
ncbi:MAG: methionine adenosyltransferase [Methylacidiphilales bacterium]|nr:methionine adenosyltransferase [Candidatus Methylacidiphilales bacterium]MDW8349677.1 methionine adenosyltransferase [Verrucomicrobiae bacterium]